MMKEKLLKRMMSVMVAVSVFVVSALTVNAADLKSENMSPQPESVDAVAQKLIQKNENVKAFKDDIYDELKILENTGLEPTFIKSIEFCEGNVVYVYDLSGGVMNKVSVDKSDTGVVLKVQEGDVHNELRMNDDGTIYLDGKLLETNNSSAENEISQNEISPRSGEVMNWVVTSCPYGSKSDYTYRLGTKKDPDITLTEEISSIATGVVVAIICANLGISAGLSKGLGTVVSWIKGRNPSTRGLSYKATNYAHKKYKNTYIKPIKKYAYRSDYTWYPEKKYKGSKYKQTLYHMKKIG